MVNNQYITIERLTELSKNLQDRLIVARTMQEGSIKCAAGSIDFSNGLNALDIVYKL